MDGKRGVDSGRMGEGDPVPVLGHEGGASARLLARAAEARGFPPNGRKPGAEWEATASALVKKKDRGLAGCRHRRAGRVARKGAMKACQPCVKYVTQS